MTTFERTVTSQLSAYQFNLIELDETVKNLSPAVRAHLQCDEQHTALKAAGLPVTIGGVEIARYAEGAGLTFAVTVGAPGYRGIELHQPELGEWLVIDPIVQKPFGVIMTDEEFKALGAIEVE